MNSAELNDRSMFAREIVSKELGDMNAFGVVTGTGWDNGVEEVFKQRSSIPYKELCVPGSDLHVQGHMKDIKIGQIGFRDAIVLGRVHPNENCTDPDLRQAMAIVIRALDKCLDGLLLTNGVGTLQGPVGREKGIIHSKIQTALLDVMGWAQRGRRQEKIGVGDIALVDDIKTALVGQFTPLGAGDFVDFYHNGIHREDDRYFDLVKGVIAKVQGHCPRAQARFIAGPQFEGPGDKREFRANGDDVIGMSGIQEALECTRLGIPFEQVVLATNGPFGVHSHETNQNTGKKNTEKSANVIRELSNLWPRRN